MNNISLRGVVVTEQLLDILLNSPIFVDKRSTRPIHFNSATIDTRVNLSEYTFDHPIYFQHATTKHPFTFFKCTFTSNLNAAHAVFDGGPPMFSQCSFFGSVVFPGARANRVSIGFSHSEFARQFLAHGMTANLNVISCTFNSDFDMHGAHAELVALRGGCSIEGNLNLTGATFSSFRTEALRASTAQQIGPFNVERDCRFERAQFGARVRLEVKAKHLNLSGTKLLQGGHISLDGGTVDLSQVSTGRSLRISGMSKGSKEAEILRLQNADVGSMSFAHVDMSRCLFYGSHNLGAVAIEPATVKFSEPPRGYARRRCVADEFAWRGAAGRRFVWRWKLAGTHFGNKNSETEDEAASIELPKIHASQVAAIYRDLRRSFEARADAPAAAEFYYGEMEMRRHDRESSRAERCIVWLYWAFSGYGLRASRALMSFAILVVVGAYAMACYGFGEGPKSFTEGLISSMYALLPGLQTDEPLSPVGHLINIVLTIFGPVLLALAVLALRGRVKR